MHHFIQDCVVKFLEINVSHSNNFQVMVDNGDRLDCNSLCSNVAIQLGNTILYGFYFTNKWYGLFWIFNGSIRWGLIITGYSNITMNCHWPGKEIHLQGINGNTN